MGMFYAPCLPTVSLPRVGASLLWDIQSPCPPPLRPWPKQSPTQNLLVLGTPAWLGFLCVEYLHFQLSLIPSRLQVELKESKVGGFNVSGFNSQHA